MSNKFSRKKYWAEYWAIRNVVYDRVDGWENLTRGDDKAVELVVKMLGLPDTSDKYINNEKTYREYERLAGPYGRAYWEMLKVKCNG